MDASAESSRGSQRWDSDPSNTLFGSSVGRRMGKPTNLRHSNSAQGGKTRGLLSIPHHRQGQHCSQSRNIGANRSAGSSSGLCNDRRGRLANDPETAGAHMILRQGQVLHDIPQRSYMHHRNQRAMHRLFLAYCSFEAIPHGLLVDEGRQLRHAPTDMGHPTRLGRKSIHPKASKASSDAKEPTSRTSSINRGGLHKDRAAAAGGNGHHAPRCGRAKLDSNSTCSH
jgi:hypothetical protein